MAQCVELVLRRYDAELLPIGQGSPREALIDDVVERQQGALSMPAWRDEPVVNAHVMDLHAYLSARAQGRIAPGRPPAG